MSAPTIKFDDGAVYERMMGKWSGLAGRAFIDWLSPPPNLRWVDIGCGNGVFTQLLVEHCAPMTVEGVDPSEGQLAFARERLATPVAKFRQGDAMALPFADGTFDAAVMALVVFFIPDPARGVADMARVVRPSGLAAAYVWDVVSGGGPSEVVIIEMKGMGFTPPRGKAEASTPEGLHALWTRAGFADIEARVLRTRRTFDDFEDYWSTTIAAPNLASMLTTMAIADVTQLKSRVREQVPIEASGRVSIEARANAIRAHRPGSAVDRSPAPPPRGCQPHDDSGTSPMMSVVGRLRSLTSLQRSSLLPPKAARRGRRQQSRASVASPVGLSAPAAPQPA